MRHVEDVRECLMEAHYIYYKMKGRCGVIRALTIFLLDTTVNLSGLVNVKDPLVSTNTLSPTCRSPSPERRVVS